MVAVRENQPAIVKLLVERGAQVNVKTRTGATPNFVLPNSVPGFGHGVGIVRGGLPAARLARTRSPVRCRRCSTPPGMDGSRSRASCSTRAPTSSRPTPTRLRRSSSPSRTTTPTRRVSSIDKGANIKAVDWYGRTPLWSAVETRNMDVDNASFVNSIDRAPFLELIQLLLDKGADPNVRMKEVPPIRRAFLRVTGSLAWVDFTGQTPFLTAALAGDVTVMRLLLKHGADPKIPTFAGTTALMAAAGVNWVFDQTYDEGAGALLEAVKLCAELGMDVNAVNSMGLTALHGAANRGSDDIIRFLVEKGAKLDVKDKEGRTPLTWAEGVFLATHPAKPKPRSIALLKSLMGTQVASRP